MSINTKREGGIRQSGAVGSECKFDNILESNNKMAQSAGVEPATT